CWSLVAGFSPPPFTRCVCVGGCFVGTPLFALLSHQQRRSSGFLWSSSVFLLWARCVAPARGGLWGASGAVGGRGKERTAKAMNKRLSFFVTRGVVVGPLFASCCFVRAEQNKINICAACRSLCRTVPPVRGSRRDSAYGRKNALNFSHRAICGPSTVRAASC
ncbi:hypothetical protein TcCL_ESM05372, partial [Trypanosoma cruzi]